MKKLILGLLILILIINLSPISYILKEKYSYINYDHSFFFNEEASGYDLNMAKRRYKKFLIANPLKAQTDPLLYRTFTIKPWQVWTWGDYILQHERFTLPYLDTNRTK